MSLTLLNDYEAEFMQQIQSLKSTVQDAKTFNGFLKSMQDPPEYLKAQSLLK